MNTADRHEEIARYAEQVRAALADLPEADQVGLLDDLEDHLAEIAADSTEPLTERLGAPESYAGELRAAYAGRDAAGRPAREAGRDRLRRRATGAHTALRRFAPYRQVGDFLPRLRPAWWVLRGVALAALTAAAIAPGPAGPVVFVLAGLAAVWVSVALGGAVRRWSRPARVLYGVGNVALVVVAAGLVAGTAGGRVGPAESPAGAEVRPFALVARAGGMVTNIYPYTRDGRPLTDVLLYDQDGRPVLLEPEVFGLELDQPCDGPPAIANSYPLKLRPRSAPDSCSRDRVPGGPGPAPAPVPSVAPTPPPTANVSPTPVPSAS